MRFLKIEVLRFLAYSFFNLNTYKNKKDFVTHRNTYQKKVVNFV